MFNMLGRSAAVGRAFSLGEEAPVTVLSDGYWRRRFGADPNIVGKSLTFNGTPFLVIGVMPPDFVFPYPGMLGPSGFTRVTSIDAWLPIAFSGSERRGQPHAQRAGSDRPQRALVGRDRPPEGGRVRGAGRSGHEDHRQPARIELPEHQQGMERDRRAVDRSIGRGDSTCAPDPDGRHRVRPRHGLGQRRQSPARAQHRPREGAGDEGGARRRTRAHRAAAAHRERDVRDRRRTGRHDRDVVDGARAHRTCAGRSAAHERSRGELAGAAGGRLDDDADRRAGGGAAGAELGEREPAGQPAGCQPRHRRRRAAPPRPRRPGDCRSCARGRDHHRSGPAAAQFRLCHQRQSRFRDLAAADVADEYSAAPDQQQRSSRLLS